MNGKENEKEGMATAHGCAQSLWRMVAHLCLWTGLLDVWTAQYRRISPSPPAPGTGPNPQRVPPKQGCWGV